MELRVMWLSFPPRDYFQIAFICITYFRAVNDNIVGMFVFISGLGYYDGKGLHLYYWHKNALNCSAGFAIFKFFAEV